MMREKRRQENEEQAKRYIVNPSGYELKPVPPLAKKMKVVKRHRSNENPFEVDQTPRRIDPE